MNETDSAYIEASNCFDFANHIWASRQKESYEQARKAYEMGVKLFEKHFSEKNACVEIENPF